jgi:hypothetical protein
MTDMTEEHVEYEDNLNFSGSVRLNFYEVMRLQSLFKKSLNDLPQQQQPVAIPPTAQQQPDYQIQIAMQNGAELIKYFSFEDLFERAKNNEKLSQIDNINIFQNKTGLSLNVYHGGFNIFSSPYIPSSKACALSIVSLLTSKQKIVGSHWRNILSFFMFSILVVVPIMIVVLNVSSSYWFLALLILPLFFSSYKQNIEWFLYSKLIDRGSAIELVPNAKDLRSDRRQRALSMFYTIFSIIGGSAIIKIIWDYISELVSK